MILIVAAIPSDALTGAIISVVDKFLPLLIGIVVVVILLMLKQSIFNILKGIGFRRNLNFQEDDIILLNGELAQIVSIGLFKTKIYMLDSNKKPKTARFFLNYTVDTLRMEKILNGYKETDKK